MYEWSSGNDAAQQQELRRAAAMLVERALHRALCGCVVGATFGVEALAAICLAFAEGADPRDYRLYWLWE